MPRLIVIFSLLIITFSLNTGISMADQLHKNSAGNAIKYKRIDVYFIRWNILTRARLSPDDVKRGNHVTMRISDDFLISEVQRQLANLKFKSEPESPQTIDARLVLEFTREDGIIDMYYANQNLIVAAETQKTAPLDQRFIDGLNVLGTKIPLR